MKAAEYACLAKTLQGVLPDEIVSDNFPCPDSAQRFQAMPGKDLGRRFGMHATATGRGPAVSCHPIASYNTPGQSSPNEFTVPSGFRLQPCRVMRTCKAVLRRFRSICSRRRRKKETQYSEQRVPAGAHRLEQYTVYWYWALGVRPGRLGH